MAILFPLSSRPDVLPGKSFAVSRTRDTLQTDLPKGMTDVLAAFRDGDGCKSYIIAVKNRARLPSSIRHLSRWIGTLARWPRAAYGSVTSSTLTRTLINSQKRRSRETRSAPPS